MSQPKILIIEHDREMNEIITFYLTKNAFTCFQAFDSNTALLQAREHCPDLILLNAQLLEIAPFGICHALRQIADIAILFLACGVEELDNIYALTPADDNDFLIKPFSLSELQSRIISALNRRGLLNISFMRRQFLEFPGLKIDVASGIVLVKDTLIDLPTIEYQLLLRLARNPGWPFTTAELFTLASGTDSCDKRSIVAHINHLRKMLEQNTTDHEYIITVWGKGYKFNDQLYLIK